MLHEKSLDTHLASPNTFEAYRHVIKSYLLCALNHRHLARALVHFNALCFSCPERLRSTKEFRHASQVHSILY